MYIGEVSEKTGISIKAIRIYQEMGLLPDVKRSGSYRVFNDTHIQILLLIKEAKRLGFKLSELKEINKNSSDPWQQVLLLIRRKRMEIDAEMERLSQLNDNLQTYEERINNCLSATPDCDFPQ